MENKSFIFRLLAVLLVAKLSDGRNDLDFSGLYTDCSKYYRCELGQLIEYKCPIGLLFDSVSKQCDFPNKVVCTEKVLTTTNKPVKSDLEFNCTDNSVFKATNCYDLYKKGFKKNGIYEIYPVNENESIRVFCEMHKGGWTRVMSKINNSMTAFNKSMQEYTNGFGEFESNNWLGLNSLRQLTNQQQMTLRIELSNDIADSYMIEYDSFLIGPASEKFKLMVGKKVFGSLEDRLSNHNLREFSTYDKISTTKHCGLVYNGGWWFGECYDICLTCQNHIAGQICMSGYCPTDSDYSYFKNTKMLIRPRF